MNKGKAINSPCPHHGQPLRLIHEDDEYLTCHSCGTTDFTPLPEDASDDLDD